MKQLTLLIGLITLSVVDAFQSNGNCIFWLGRHVDLNDSSSTGALKTHFEDGFFVLTPPPPPPTPLPPFRPPPPPPSSPALSVSTVSTVSTPLTPPEAAIKR